MSTIQNKENFFFNDGCIMTQGRGSAVLRNKEYCSKKGRVLQQGRESSAHSKVKVLTKEGRVQHQDKKIIVPNKKRMYCTKLEMTLFEGRRKLYAGRVSTVLRKGLYSTKEG